jgi:propanol-preferring alcohol dehydrogenase
MGPAGRCIRRHDEHREHDHHRPRFEVLYEATLWGTIKELREVVALAESGRLTPIPVETAALQDINRVYERVKRGEVQGRAVITPNA